MQYGIKRSLPSGRLLLEKGMPATYVGFLTRGRAQTFCLNPDGEEIPLFYLDADSMFGTEALIAHPQVIVSVGSISPVEFYVLSPDLFLKLWQERKLPLQELIAHFVQRITLLSDYICCSHFLKGDQRVAYFLYACCTSSGDIIPYTHEQLAAVTGMSRVSVSRILRQFQQAGIIRQEYRRIQVLEPQRLSAIFHALGYFLE